MASRRPRGGEERREARLAWALCAPALATMGAVAIFPLLWTAWESLHLDDLRMPWRGRPFVGLANYAEALGAERFLDALGHTLFFTGASVALEMVLGLALALALHRAFRGRGLARTAALLPWALPTVVAALIWRFLFEGSGVLTDPQAAWGPVVLADVWKTTPFVALLLLAGLQAVDADLVEAARVDGASTWQVFRHVTLPHLRPALAVAVVFRGLDALRVFDLIYALTNGGPGTATEPLALLAFASLLQDLRFGYGSALSMILFGLSFALAALGVRWAGVALLERGR
jgi:ABC-type sugar transport system permease subunit